MMHHGADTGGICLAAAFLPPPKLLSRCSFPPKAMAFFLLILANDTEQTVFSLRLELQNHTGKVSQVETFLPRSFILRTAALCPQPTVTSPNTQHNLLPA